MEKEEETPLSQESRVEGHHPGSGNRRPGVDKYRVCWGSSSMASSHSEGESGLGSNLRVTDTEPRTRAPLRASPDARRDPTEVIEDAPLSD